MLKWILIMIGIISALYGIIVLQVGSGTMFWVLWEMIALFFLFWAFLIYKDFFATYKIFKIIFHLVLVVGIAVMIIFCGMIAKEFNAKGKPDLDYIIVLGAQVRENGPSVVLRYRLDAAIDYLEENPDTICIVSGGQGPNEPFPEAQGMYEYLIEKGVSEKRILLEDKSQSTVENIQNSKQLMDTSYEDIGVVTNNFHMFRALRIAKMQGLDNVYGIAAKSNTLYLPNNVLRECLSILKALAIGSI